MAESIGISIFISSPTDLMPEREIVERAVARVQDVWQGYVQLKAVRWERKYYEASRSFQEAIGDMAAFQIVIGLVWKRIGSALPPDKYRRADGSPYESGTVFELESALASSKESGRPAVYLFRKTTPITYTAEGVDEERRQFESLDAWWNRTFRDEQGHFRRGYQSFATQEALEREIENLLEDYLREHHIIPSGPAWNIETKGSPYPGLVPYDKEYSGVFFGRSLATSAAVDEMMMAYGRDTPALFVVGPSGAGKSSLARAGLAPRIMGAQIKGIDFWRLVVIEPSEDAFSGFVQRLYDEALPELSSSPQRLPTSFSSLARTSPDDAASTIQWALEEAARRAPHAIGLPAGRLLIVVDQLEAILDSPHCESLAKLLRALVQGGSTWLLVTLRSDRYAELQLNRDLLALRQRGAMFDLPPPGASEIADIIRGPARAADLKFEEKDGESLAKVIGTAVRGADALPLLQMTLKRLFDAREDHILTFASYKNMGGLEGAIAAHAEAVFNTVSPEGQFELDTLLRVLVNDIDQTGRLSINTPDLASLPAGPAIHELIGKLTEGRLLVNVDGSIRVAHEALLRNWQRAAESPALNPEVVRLRRQIEPSFEAWQGSLIDGDLLQPGTTALAAADNALRTHPAAFPPDLKTYIRRSVAAAAARTAAATRRARRAAIGGMVAASVFGGVAVVALVYHALSQRNLSLALLTKAELHLIQERAARTFVIGAAAVTSNPLLHLIERFGAFRTEVHRNVRAHTLARIGAVASIIPLRSLNLGKNEARSVSFSQDGKQIAVGDRSGRLLVTDVDGGGKDTLLQAHEQDVSSVKFGPDGRWIATGSNDGTVRLWSTQTSESRVLCGHKGRVNDVGFDPAGRFLASTGNDGQIIIRDRNADFASIQPPGLTEALALAVSFSPDGKTLASSDEDGNVYQRSTEDWSIRRFRTNRTGLVSIAFSTDGNSLATASIHGQLDVWDARTMKHIRQIDTGGRKLWKVRYSPDGRFLAAASWDGVVSLWHAGTSYASAGSVDAHDHWINDIAFSGDSSLLATASESGVVRIWRTADIRPMFEEVKTEERETLTGSYSPDGTRFVAGGRDGSARLYGVDSHGMLQFRCAVKHSDWVWTAAFSKDSKRVVSAGTKDGKTDNAIYIWDTDDCHGIREIAVGADFVSRAVFRPDGRQIAWGTRRGEIRLMDLDQQTAARQSSPRGALQAGAPAATTLSGRHAGAIVALDFSPDGRYLASGGTPVEAPQSGNVVVWDIKSHAVHREFRGNQKRVTAVKYAPDGRFIASSGYHSEIVLWDPSRENGPIARLPMKTGASGALMFNSAGDKLASGADGRYVGIWSLPAGEPVFELSARVGVRGVFGFHPQREDLAFDGADGVVRILPGVALQKKAAFPRMPHQILGTEAFFDRGELEPIDSARVKPIDGKASDCPKPVPGR